MQQDRNDDRSKGESPEEEAVTTPPLSRPIQEHLGRQLRSAYNDSAPRPAFLGDTNVPPEFERLIRRIEITEKVREVGVEAVRQALDKPVAGDEYAARTTRHDPD